MKHTLATGTPGLLRVALALLLSAAISRSAISFTDIRLWAGDAPGPGISEAAVVVDFRDGSPGLLWGYRWPSSETRTGRDMLTAVMGADPLLGVDSTFFPNSILYGGRSRSFSDNGTPANYFDDSYWGYWVNNNVYYDPNNFLLNAHIVPPATEVAPLGNPYGSGAWVESSTGTAARPLVNGSWDGWVYGVYGTQPGEPVAAVPEPGAGGLLGMAAAGVLARRRRKFWARTAPAACMAEVPALQALSGLDGRPGAALVPRLPRAIKYWPVGPSEKEHAALVSPLPRAVECWPVGASDKEMARYHCLRTIRLKSTATNFCRSAATVLLRPNGPAFDSQGQARNERSPWDPKRESRSAESAPPAGRTMVILRYWRDLISPVTACMWVIFLLSAPVRAAGPFPPGPSQPGSDAIPAASALFQGWAKSVISYQPGPRQAGTLLSAADYGSAASATGPADALGAPYDTPAPASPVLSLGDGGRVTLLFSPPIAEGDGADFAVFENGFAMGSNALFAELAFVEVSSNGAEFVRFPAISCTQTAAQTASFGTLDPRDLHNLAGKHPAGYGTPFDLAELAGTHPALDVSHIRYVRLIDVTGDVLTGFGSRDANGNWINDPFPTPFQTGGFDLDAVGVIHQAPDPWQEWIGASFDAAVQDDAGITGPAKDPDGDGKINLVEYACGSPPSAADGVPPVAVASSYNSVVLQFHRMRERSDISLTLEESADGAKWAPLASSIGGNAVTSMPNVGVSESGAPLVLVTVTAPLTETRRFYRLAVQRAS